MYWINHYSANNAIVLIFLTFICWIVICPVDSYSANQRLDNRASEYGLGVT